MDPNDEQPDTHAATRERRQARQRHGMQVTGRSTKTVLPDQIARRGREADERLRDLRPRPGPPDSPEDAEG